MRLELLIAHCSIAISVERGKKDRDILFADSQLEFFACLPELPRSETSTLVIVHHVKNTLKSDHSSHAPMLQFVAEKLHKV